MQTFKGFQKQLLMLFAALLIGQIAVSLVLWQFVAPVAFSGDLTLVYIGGVMLAALTGVSVLLGNKLLAAARELSGVAERVLAFRKAHILRMALREGAVLINLILYFFVTGHSWNLWFAGIGILLFALLFPSRDRIVRDLGLGTQDVAALDSGAILLPMPVSEK